MYITRSGNDAISYLSHDTHAAQSHESSTFDSTNLEENLVAPDFLANVSYGTKQRFAIEDFATIDRGRKCVFFARPNFLFRVICFFSLFFAFFSFFSLFSFLHRKIIEHARNVRFIVILKANQHRGSSFPSTCPRVFH